MQKTSLSLFLSLYSCLTLSAGCLDKLSWQHCSTTEGIQTCSAKYGKSDILAFRGQATIKAPLKQLVSVFYDVEHYQDWQVNLKAINIVEDIIPLGKSACEIERIEHSFGKKPWFVSWAFWVPDSEFLYKASYHLTPDAKHFALYLDTHQNEDIPQKKGYQRGAVQSCYILDSTENTNETLIRAELWVDLNLAVTASRINSKLKHWPIDIIKGLQRKMAKADVNRDVTDADAFVTHCLKGDVQGQNKL